MLHAVFNPNVVSIFAHEAMLRGHEDGTMHMIDGEGPHSHVARGNWLQARKDDLMLEYAYWGGYTLATGGMGGSGCFSPKGC